MTRKYPSLSRLQANLQLSGWEQTSLTDCKRRVHDTGAVSYVLCCRDVATRRGEAAIADPEKDLPFALDCEGHRACRAFEVHNFNLTPFESLSKVQRVARISHDPQTPRP